MCHTIPDENLPPGSVLSHSLFLYILIYIYISILAWHAWCFRKAREGNNRPWCWLVHSMVVPWELKNHPLDTYSWRSAPPPMIRLAFRMLAAHSPLSLSLYIFISLSFSLMRSALFLLSWRLFTGNNKKIK